MGEVEGVRGGMDRIDFDSRRNIESCLLEPERESAYASEEVNDCGPGYGAHRPRTRMGPRRRCPGR